MWYGWLWVELTEISKNNLARYTSWWLPFSKCHLLKYMNVKEATGESFRKWLSFIKALPLLPPVGISECWDQLVDEEVSLPDEYKHLFRSLKGFQICYRLTFNFISWYYSVPWTKVDVNIYLVIDLITYYHWYYSIPFQNVDPNKYPPLISQKQLILFCTPPLMWISTQSWY